MSGIFGDQARKDAQDMQASAREEKQLSSEETNRAQQRAERGAGSSRKGRSLLMGDMNRASSGGSPTSTPSRMKGGLMASASKFGGS